MADEVRVSIALSYLKGGRFASTRDMGTLGLEHDVTGTDFKVATQSIGFSASEAINKGEVTTPGWFVVKNLDATNFVEIDKATFSSPGTVKIKPGEVQAFRFGSSAPHALANTAAVEIAFILIED
jgi:hypothetical protein